MTCATNLVREDTREQIQRTLRLLPDGSARQRLEQQFLHQGRTDPACLQQQGSDPIMETVLGGIRRILQRTQTMLTLLAADPSRQERLMTRLTAHRRVYQTPYLPQFECSIISPQLLAGRNPLTERDVEWLEDMGVTHDLDLREESEWLPPRFGLAAVQRLGAHRQWLPVQDMGAPTPATLDQACRYLDEVLALPGSVVYVHCRAGRERTAAVLVAYFAKLYRMGYDETLTMLRKRRPSLKPLENQEQAVRDWLGSIG